MQSIILVLRSAKFARLCILLLEVCRIQHIYLGNTENVICCFLGRRNRRETCVFASFSLINSVSKLLQCIGYDSLFSLCTFLCLFQEWTLKRVVKMANNRIPSGPNTPGSQQTPTQQGTKIFIQRDYSEGTAVKFQTRFPPELEDRVSESHIIYLMSRKWDKRGDSD